MKSANKPVFKLSAWYELFKECDKPFPTNNEDLIETFSDPAVPIVMLERAIMEKTNWDKQALEENCPMRKQKVSQFLALYEVDYTTEFSASSSEERKEEKTQIFVRQSSGNDDFPEELISAKTVTFNGKSSGSDISHDEDIPEKTQTFIGKPFGIGVSQDDEEKTRKFTKPFHQS